MTAPTPDCPGCEQPPRYLMGGGTQAWCANLDCNILTWNPTKTLDELADGIKRIDLSGWLSGGGA